MLLLNKIWMGLGPSAENVKTRGEIHQVYYSEVKYIYRQSSVKKTTSKNTSSNNTFHIFTLFTTLLTSTLANIKIEQKSIVYLGIN